MSRKMWCVALVLVLTACAPTAVPSALPTQPLVASTETPSPQPPTMTATVPGLPGPAQVIVSETPVVSVPAQAQAMIGVVIADLAHTLDVAEADVRLQTVEAVVWPDANLGCGQAAQADESSGSGVAGYEIALEYQGRAYRYHTGEAGRFRICEGGEVEIPQGEPIILDPVLNSLIDLARRDLAQRLDLPLRRMFLSQVTPYEWPDTSLGCPLSDQDYAQDSTSGYRILLRVGQEMYPYHSSYIRVLYCPAESEVLPSVQSGPVEDVSPAPPES